MRFVGIHSSRLRPYLVISLVVILSSLAVLLPFMLNLTDLFSIHFWQTGMQAVYRFWDGPLYVVVSRTFYTAESPLYTASGLWASYFSAHFPLYPFAILLLSPLGPFPGMVVATILFALAAILVFYKIVRDFSLTPSPLLLTLFFCFFPLRWFLYRNVGASEPAFIFFCLAAVYFLKKDQIPFSVIAASLATLTRIFGFILFPVVLVSLYLKGQLNPKNFLLSLVIPAALMALFAYYAVSLGDFFAYFGVNEGNIHEPFRIMVTFSDMFFRELYGALIIVYALAAVALWERGEREMSLFILVYLPLVSLITHGDASRYMIPMAPFALIGFEPVFPKNKFVFGGIVFIAAVLALIYAWTSIPLNPMPEETFLAIKAALGMP
jgi:Gpi18-like mannosyltransferase